MLLTQIGYDVLPYIVSIVVAFGGYLLTHVGTFLKAKIGEKNLSNIEKKLGIAEQQIAQKKGIAYDAVRWAEDTFKNIGGEEKLSKAVDWALNEAKILGVQANKQQLEDKIRVAYTEFKPKLIEEAESVLNGDSTNVETTPTKDAAPTQEAAQEPTDSEQTNVNTQPETPQPVKQVSDMTSEDLKQLITQVVNQPSTPQAAQ